MAVKQQPSILARPQQQGGFTLIELILATAIGALLLSALMQVARLATQSQHQLHDATEQRIAAAFVLQRLRAAAQAALVADLQPDGIGDTGQWLAPKRFCLNAQQALVETNTDDNSCSAGEVIADRVEDFRIRLLASQSALSAPVVMVSVTLAPTASATDSTVISQSIRLKGLRE